MANQEIKLVITGENRASQAILSTSNGLSYLEGTLTKLSIQMTAFSTAWNSAMVVVQRAMQYIDQGAAALRAEEAFSAMANSVGVNAQKMAADMRKAADGFVDDSHLMQKAAFAMSADIDPDKIPKVFEAARLAARLTGQDVGSSIDGMVQAISTNMPRSLRQMGMITKEQMTVLNQAVAAGVDDINLLDLVLANATVKTAELGGTQEHAAKQIARFRVEIEELQETLGKGLITGLQLLFGVFQSGASAILMATSALPKFMEYVSRLSAFVLEKTGQADKAAFVRKDAATFQKLSEDLFGSGVDLGNKAYANIYGAEKTPVIGPSAQDAAKARAARDAMMADLKKKIKAARGNAGTTGREDAWEQIERGLQADIDKSGLGDFEKKVIEIDKKVAELLEKAAELPTASERAAAGKKIGDWQAAMFDDASTEAASKGYDDYLEKLKDQRDLEKELKDIRLKASQAREAQINADLAALDLAEKEGTAHRDTIAERIDKTKELIANQEAYLQTLDKSKDPTAWYAQLDAINKFKTALANLKNEQRPVFAALRDYAESASDTWKNVADTISGTFKGMEDALVEFVRTGKLNFTDLANSIIADMTRIMVRQGITGPLAQAAGNWISGGSGLSNSSDSVLGSWGDWSINTGSWHSGGLASEAKSYRMVPNLAFAGAPRFHGGFAPDEYPAVLQKGEGVFTAGQMKAMGMMAGKPSGQNIRVELVNQSSQPMKSTQSDVKFDGQEYVVTVWLDALSRNAYGLRNALGGA